MLPPLRRPLEPPEKSQLQSLSWKKTFQVLKVKGLGNVGQANGRTVSQDRSQKPFFPESAPGSQGAPDDPIGLFLARPQDGEVTVGEWGFLCSGVLWEVSSRVPKFSPSPLSYRGQHCLLSPRGWGQPPETTNGQVVQGQVGGPEQQGGPAPTASRQLRPSQQGGTPGQGHRAERDAQLNQVYTAQDA